MGDREDGDERSFEFDQTTILEQQLQSYILSVLHQQNPRDERVQNFHRSLILHYFLLQALSPTSEILGWPFCLSRKKQTIKDQEIY